MAMRIPSSSGRSFITVDVLMALIFVGSVLVVLLVFMPATVCEFTRAVDQFNVTVVGTR